MFHEFMWFQLLSHIPYQTGFRGRIFMTHATKVIYKLLVTDYLKISKGAEDNMLFTEKDIEKSMDRIEVCLSLCHHFCFLAMKC